jgi:anti-sigma-K factor RskA
MAAVLVLLLGGGAILVDRTGQLDRAKADAAALAGVTAILDGILQDPAHQVALLETPAGAPAGTVSWSASDQSVVVLTTALQSPPAGQVYRCWIERNGASVGVGEMQFNGSTAYWAGSLGSWGDGLAPGGRFWVSLEPIGGSSKGTLVLAGTL